MSAEAVMDESRLPDSEILALKRFHKTLKVKREADTVKAVYLLGAGHQVKLTAEVLDLDAQTVRQYFLDYQKQHQWIQLHYTGKESSLTNEQEQELVKHLDEKPLSTLSTLPRPNNTANTTTLRIRRSGKEHFD
jgi:transposase